MDDDQCFAAVQSRDPRFDGWFVLAVTSTGIYCRPSCPAATPRRANARFFPTTAASQQAGFRACRRCRPDATPGSPAWDLRADLVGRAMRLIADGVVDREGVVGLAVRLGYSVRHVHRQLVAEVGAGPVALARAQRAHAARVLLEATDLACAPIAFAAGFGSVRQFNDTIREVFGTTPTALRGRRGGATAGGSDGIVLRLAHRQPADIAGLIRYLAARAVPGVEEVLADGTYRCGVTLPHGQGVVDLQPGPGHVRAVVQLEDLRDVTAVVQRCRRLLDLDADPTAIVDHLRSDPRLAPLLRSRPGLRVPRCMDPFEAAVRVVVGQQVGIPVARRLVGRLAGSAGQPLRRPRGSVAVAFPDADRLAGSDLVRAGLTQRRVTALYGLAAETSSGTLPLDAGVDRQQTRQRLARLPGIGPWTVEEIARRGLGDPDAFPVTDLALRRAGVRLGLPGDPGSLRDRARRWRPWRAYAAQHLWTEDGERRRVDAAGRQRTRGAEHQPPIRRRGAA